MAHSYVKWGDWNACCDVCGLRFKASEMQQRWDGLMVCAKDWEPRHPQDYIRVRGDNVSVPWTRPEGDLFTGPACWIWERTGYADLATADCARADWNQPSYEVALELRGPPSANEGVSAIPSYAIPGFSIPATTFPLA